MRRFKGVNDAKWSLRKKRNIEFNAVVRSEPHRVNSSARPSINRPRLGARLAAMGNKAAVHSGAAELINVCLSKPELGCKNAHMSKPLYIRCRWLHELKEEPIDIWSEFGPDGYERRKLEYFIDGTIGYANIAESTEERTGTSLADQKVPDIDEINRDPQFKVVEVTKADFEKRWEQRQAN